MTKNEISGSWTSPGGCEKLNQLLNFSLKVGKLAALFTDVFEKNLSLFEKLFQHIERAHQNEFHFLLKRLTTLVLKPRSLQQHLFMNHQVIYHES